MSESSDAESGIAPQSLRVPTNVSSRSRRLDGAFGHFADLVQTISNQDAITRYKTEEADNGIPIGDLTDTGQFRDAEGRTILSWEAGDKENPYNWPLWRKNVILLTTMLAVSNSTMGSALPSMAIPFIAREWGITSQIQLVLPISAYLVGYVCGPMIWGPLSEHIGRRNLSIGSFFMLTVWTLACALAPNWPALLIFRFFAGASGSAPIAIVTGIFADIYDDSVVRGRAMAWFMATTVFGPLFAPIISGFCSTSIGWRWSFWVGLMSAGATLVLVCFLPETYAPVLLSRRAAKIRKADPTVQVYSATELDPHDFRQLVTRVLTRPIRMLLTELIVTATCLYLSLVYAIFYMSFQAFPIIFQNVYGLSPGVTGLCYLPIGAGALLSLPVFFSYDYVLLNAKARGAEWAQKEEFRRVPLATLGGPLFVVSLFWLGWSARSNVPFVVPMLAGIPFGAGFMLIFMALLNYITDAYEIFAASANAAASSCRSVFAVILPLATRSMFARLGINGACSLLGGLSLVMCVIPFIFIWKGEEIRARSKFCLALREQKLEMEQRNTKLRSRRMSKAGDRERVSETKESV